MDGVTDAAYRFIQKKYGNPDLVMTEFTNVIGLTRGADRLFLDQLYHNLERPIIGQIYGASPEDFYHAAKIIAALEFDGIDINMGCPAKNVAASGAGAGLIRTPELAKKIVAATRKGVNDFFADRTLTGAPRSVEAKVAEANALRNATLPAVETFEERAANFTLSIKTRIGYDQNIVTEWLKHLTETEPDFISLHGRTLKQLYGGMSSWDAIAEGVQSTHIPILANGDITTNELAVKALAHTKARGVLIGRGTFGNPWIFQHNAAIKAGQFEPDNRPDLNVVMEVMQEHAELHWQLKDPGAFAQIRKNLAWYVKGIPGAAAFRAQLVNVQSPEEVVKICANILQQT
jgi:tRNA-dihydrouridine synthase B